VLLDLLPSLLLELRLVQGDSWIITWEHREYSPLFMLGSFPVTLFAMVRVSLLLVARAQDRIAGMDTESQENNETTSQEEEAHR